MASLFKMPFYFEFMIFSVWLLTPYFNSMCMGTWGIEGQGTPRISFHFWWKLGDRRSYVMAASFTFGFLFIQSVVCFYYRNLFIVSDLNGNNGSATNSDDVEEEDDGWTSDEWDFEIEDATDWNFVFYGNGADYPARAILIELHDLPFYFYTTEPYDSYTRRYRRPIETLHFACLENPRRYRLTVNGEVFFDFDNFESQRFYVDYVEAEALASGFRIDWDGAAAFLNGANGEFTGTDDLASVNQADRLRAGKEARNRMVHARAGKARAGDGPKPGRAGRGDGPRPVRRVRAGVLEKPPPPGRGPAPNNNPVGGEPHVLAQPPGDNPNNPQGHGPGDRPPEVEAVMDDYRPVRYYHFMGFNYLIQEKNVVLYNPDDRDIRDYDYVEQVMIPAFNAMGRVFPAVTCHMSNRLYNHVLLHLRVLPDESRNYGVIMAFMIQCLGDVPAGMRRSLVHFYCWMNSMKAAPGGGVVIGQHLRVVVNLAEVRTIPLQLSIVKHYTYNGKWRIREGSRGFTFRVGRDGVPEVYPTFETSPAPEPIAARCKRAFFNFAPSRPFQTYANCAHNITAALARYFQSIPDQETRTAGQMRLIDDLDPTLVDSLAQLCGAKVVWPRFEYIPFENDTRDMVAADRHDVEFAQDVLPIYIGGSITFRPCYLNQLQRRFSEEVPFSVDSYPTFGSVVRDHKPLRGIAYYFHRFVDYYASKFGWFFNQAVQIVYSPFYHYVDRFTVLSAFVSLPIPKRLLYSQYITDPITFAKIADNQGSFESKFKWEFGKYRKVGRLYGTGQWLTLVDKTCVDVCKFFFKQDIYIGTLPTGGKFWAKFKDAQDAPSSDAVFNDARFLAVGDVCFYFYSDDGFLVSNTGGVLEIVETDISSCDASNGFAVFASLYYISSIVGLEGQMRILLSQCTRSTRVVNPDNHGEFVVLEPQSFFEYSGHNATTALNNCASLAIAIGIFKALVADPDRDLEEACVQGAHRYGWELTTQRKNSFNAVTFLKRACAISGRSWKVYGCILRSAGLVDGVPNSTHFGVSYQEFKKAGPIRLAELLLVQLVDGLVGEPGSPVLNALRVRAGYAAYPEEVTIEDLNQRYGTESWEWGALIDSILTLQYGDAITLPVLDKIYHVDYGVEVGEPGQGGVPGPRDEESRWF